MRDVFRVFGIAPTEAQSRLLDEAFEATVTAYRTVFDIWRELSNDPRQSKPRFLRSLSAERLEIKRPGIFDEDNWLRPHAEYGIDSAIGAHVGYQKRTTFRRPNPDFGRVCLFRLANEGMLEATQVVAPHFGAIPINGQLTVTEQPYIVTAKRVFIDPRGMPTRLDPRAIVTWQARAAFAQNASADETRPVTVDPNLFQKD